MNRTWLVLAGAALMSLLAAGLLFRGLTPAVAPVWRALPPPDETVPHVLAVGRGEDLPTADLVRVLVETGKGGNLLLSQVVPFLGFLRRMDRLAVVVGFDDTGPRISGAFYPVREDLKTLRGGEMPPLWVERGFIDGADPAGDGTWSVRFPGQRELLLRLNGSLLLLAASRADLDLMERNLEAPDPWKGPSWTLRPGWDTHLRFHEAGVLGDALFLGGIDVGERVLSAEMAWKKGKDGRELAWKIDGLEDVLTDWGFSDRGREPSWISPVTLPSPVLLSLGVDLPTRFLQRFGGDLDRELRPGGVFPGRAVVSLKDGPMVLSLAGRSRLFLFSAPGAYVQLFRPGSSSRILVERLWEREWAFMRDRRTSLDGFEWGGGVSRPFSLVGAAGDDRAIVGLLSPSQVDDGSPPGELLKADLSGSCLWFFGDFPGLTAAVEKWARFVDYARSVGFELPEGESLTGSVRRLDSLGKLSLVLKNPFEGWASWTGGEDALP